MITQLQREGSHPGMFASPLSTQKTSSTGMCARAHTNTAAYTPRKTRSSQVRRTVNVTADEDDNPQKQEVVSLLVLPAHGSRRQTQKPDLFKGCRLFPCVSRKDTLPPAPDNLLLSHCVMLYSFNARLIRAHMHVFLCPYGSSFPGQTHHHY